MSSLGLFPGVVQYVPSFLGLWDGEEVFVSGSGKLGTVRTHVVLTHPPPTTCGGVETDIVWNNVGFKSVTNTKKPGVPGWHSTYRVYYILVDYTILYYTRRFVPILSLLCCHAIPRRFVPTLSQLCPYSVPYYTILYSNACLENIIANRCHFPIVVGVSCVLVIV